MTKKVRDESSAGQDVGMCAKLTAVFGITWLLGLGAGYHIALRIIYIICNSLQGKASFLKRVFTISCTMFLLRLSHPRAMCLADCHVGV